MGGGRLPLACMWLRQALKEHAHRRRPCSLAMSMTTLTFAVRQREPVLVGPAKPTPRETKRLSDIDDQDILRCRAPLVFFYRGGVHGAGGDRDPAAVIRRALGEALVPYYPLAGRLREVEGRKLVVDCTGEGVLFVEADADVRLAELEEANGLRAPFPCMDQFQLDFDSSKGVLDCPLLLIQVMRLRCGGFIVALRLNHPMCDGTGIAQFMSAVGKLARGFPTVTVEPAWSRHLLEARSPPEGPAFPHREYDAVPMPPPPSGEMIMRTFTFGRADMASIKKGLPAAATTAGALLAGSLGDAVALVREAKAMASTAEYVRSTLDALVMRGRPPLALANTFLVSDNRHAGYHRVDFGWGEPVYGGPANCAVFGASTLFAVKNEDGEDATGMLVVLPQPAMDRFASEVETLRMKG